MSRFLDFNATSLWYHRRMSDSQTVSPYVWFLLQRAWRRGSVGRAQLQNAFRFQERRTAGRKFALARDICSINHPWCTLQGQRLFPNTTVAPHPEMGMQQLFNHAALLVFDHEERVFSATGLAFQELDRIVRYDPDGRTALRGVPADVHAALTSAPGAGSGMSAGDLLAITRGLFGLAPHRCVVLPGPTPASATEPSGSRRERITHALPGPILIPLGWWVGRRPAARHDAPAALLGCWLDVHRHPRGRKVLYAPGAVPVSELQSGCYRLGPALSTILPRLPVPLDEESVATLSTMVETASQQVITGETAPDGLVPWFARSKDLP